MRKKIETKPISEKKLKEVYDGAQGRRSHFLFFNSEPEEFVDQLEKEGFIKKLSNSENRRWYTITDKLILIFREHTENELSQMKAQTAAEVEEERLELIELENLSRDESSK